MQNTNRFNGLKSKAAALGTGLAASFYGAAAMAQAADPTTAVVAEITKGQGYGVAVAVALTVAIFAIRAIKMTRKG